MKYEMMKGQNSKVFTIGIFLTLFVLLLLHYKQYDVQNKDIISKVTSGMVDDPKYSDLLDTIRRKMLVPPSEEPYRFQKITPDSASQSDLESEDFNPSCGQVQKMEDILRTFTPGFYVDCGANDGVLQSNTLWLERKLNWSGILIEADPNAWQKLISVHRKGWHLNACLSVTDTAEATSATFYLNPGTSAVSGLVKSKTFRALKPIQIPCLPLYSVLLALNRTTVDFFTLDVEGSELDILRTIPFDKVIFKVLAIEHLFIPGGKTELRKFMESKGYVFYRTIIKAYNDISSCSGDSIYLHSSVQLTQKQKQMIGHEDPELIKAKRV